tara:strand:- start:799 stop:1248 length:450 start_codon:yes stop_codon:yes gene_type:complete
MVTKKKKVIKKKVMKKKFVKKPLRNNLSIHFMPYSEIAREDSIGRIKKIMGIILKNRIIILQGKLQPEDETKLIENSMTLIGNIPNFQGIEVAAISGDNGHKNLFHKIRRNIAKILVGEQDAITIMGPASIVKEITRDPKKIELMLQRR